MARFNREKLEDFLGTVRKYMQVRGPYTQKDLAEFTGVGVSTMSRFLSQKTTELNPQLIAKVVAKLAIPLHEIIDFVEENYADQFIRLVKFYKEEQGGGGQMSPAPDEVLEPTRPINQGRRADDFADDFSDALTPGGGTAQRNATARINMGGKTRTIPFNADEDAPNSEKSLKEKLESLTPRQRAYMTDFLNLDVEGRDLMVDIGNSLLRYFKQKGMKF